VVGFQTNKSGSKIMNPAFCDKVDFKHFRYLQFAEMPGSRLQSSLQSARNQLKLSGSKIVVTFVVRA